MPCELAFDILIAMDEITFKGEGPRYDNDGNKVRMSLDEINLTFGYFHDAINTAMSELRKGKLITNYEFGHKYEEGYFCTQKGHSAAQYIKSKRMEGLKNV